LIVLSGDGAPFTRELTPKAVKRIKKGQPKERDLRDYSGAIYKEQLGEAADERLPKFDSYPHMNFGKYIEAISSNKVKSVEVWRDKEPYWWPPWRTYFDGQRAIVTLTEDVGGGTFRVDMPLPELEEVALHAMTSAETNVGFHQPPGRDGMNPLDLALLAISAGVFVFTSIYLGIIKKSGIPMDQVQALEFAQSRSEARKEGKTDVKFSDVAALGSVVEELEEVVAFLKDPQRFNSVGARPPKGLLLEGGPGVGKTLIAKAVAGEAGVPFYSMSGPEFVEIIVGVGAARVRDLFKRARVNAPCLIFIDEIDALGGKRAPAMVRGNEEREQTLNQLLTEMDGFTPDTGVIFIGATNRADLLDPALLRPGRFDRKVTVHKPTTQGRADILKVHARKITLSKEVDLDQLARDLPGLSGAELANVLNESALCALRRGGSAEEGVMTQDVYAAVDRILLGVRRAPLPQHLPVVRVLAGHEMGHAMVATVLRGQTQRLEAVERVSIQPRGDEWTRTMFLRADDEAYSLVTRARLLERLQVVLGGRAAEEVMFGQPGTHSMGDIQAATVLARRLVTNYGLLNEGAVPTFVDLPATAGLGAVYNMWQKFSGQVEGVDSMGSNEGYQHMQPSDSELQRVHSAANNLVCGAYAADIAILTRHKQALTAATDLILDKEQLEGHELQAILDSQPVDESVDEASTSNYAAV